MEIFGELCGELCESFGELCVDLWKDLASYAVSCGKIWQTMR